jgi:hypothetical protein
LFLEFDQLRTEWRQNHGIATLEKLRNLLARNDFGVTEPEVCASILRLTADVELQLTQDLKKAEELIKRADELTEPNRAVHARLIAARLGPREGAKQLELPATLEEWNQRMGFLLQAGETDSMLSEWNTPPEGIGPDFESHRLRTLALITKKDIAAAGDAFKKIGPKQAQTFGVHFAGAALDYFRAVSTAAPDQVFQLHPNPIPLEYIKRDAQSLGALDRAALVFGQLMQNVMPQSDLHFELAHWRLAALANHAARRAEAEEFCRGLISSKPSDVQPVAWASLRGYSIDHESSVAALAAELKVTL